MEVSTLVDLDCTIVYTQCTLVHCSMQRGMTVPLSYLCTQIACSVNATREHVTKGKGNIQNNAVIFGSRLTLLTMCPKYSISTEI